MPAKSESPAGCLQEAGVSLLRAAVSQLFENRNRFPPRKAVPKDLSRLRWAVTGWPSANSVKK